MIRRAAFALAATLLATGACAAPTPRPVLPADVRMFVAQRAQCDHLRGEEPYDAARAAELAWALRKNCTGTDAELARLKHRHRHERDAMRALAGYDPRIE